MHRYLKIIFALAAAVCAAAAYADPPGRVGRVNYASGAVSFAPAEAQDQWVQAPLNRPLTSGDRLWADTGGRAELHIGSTALRMGERTQVDVLNLDDRTIQLRLAQGDLTARVRDLPPGDRIEIATPSGAVVIQQPGSYRVSADPQGASRVNVQFGQAQVVTPAQPLTVPSSQSLWFANGAPPQFEVINAASADAFDRWNADRDRREDRIASTRYVSPNMTGYEDLDQYGTWRSFPEYGAVWVPTNVAPGWAPYRQGHWAWISPWGWTWVDDAPWGFAPFHYGRWVNVNGYWAWAPGTYIARPVYAPALVAFIGGSNFSVSISSGPTVGWFPLGWREPYHPWYSASPTYVRNVNVTHVTNVTNVTNVTYVNRANPQAVTVVPQQAFVSARPVAQNAVAVQPAALARAEVLRDRSPAEPARGSFAQQERRGQRPPERLAAPQSAAPAVSTATVTAPAQPAAAAAPAPVAPAPRVAAPASAPERTARPEREQRQERRAEQRREAPAAVPAPPAAARVEAPRPPQRIEQPRREPPQAAQRVEPPRAEARTPAQQQQQREQAQQPPSPRERERERRHPDRPAPPS